MGDLAHDLMDVEHSDTTGEDSRETFNAVMGMQIDEREMTPRDFHTSLETRELLKACITFSAFWNTYIYLYEILLYISIS